MFCFYLPNVDSRTLFSNCQKVLKATISIYDEERQRLLGGLQYKSSREFRVLCMSIQNFLSNCKEILMLQISNLLPFCQYDFRADKNIFNLWHFDGKSKVLMVMVQGPHANNFLFVASNQILCKSHYISLQEFFCCILLVNTQKNPHKMT